MKVAMAEKNTVNIDFHSHILPGIDDGATDPDVSRKQLLLLKKQGVDKVFLTPHFDFRYEEKNSFLTRREEAYNALLSVYDRETMPAVYLGSEIYMSFGMDKYDFDGLQLEGTGIYLIEFPRQPYGAWMAELIETLLFERRMSVMIAHVNRVTDVYDKKVCRNLFDYEDLIFQINTEAFRGFIAKDPFKNYDAAGLKFVLGTDTHDLDSRAPDYDRALKKLNSSSLSYIKKSVELTTALISKKISKNTRNGKGADNGAF